MSKYLTSSIGRIRFINIIEPNKLTGKFDLTLLLPKDDIKAKEFVKTLWDATKVEAAEASQKATDKNANSVDALLRRCSFLRDGDKKEQFSYVDRDTGETKNSWRAEYEGNFIIRARRKPNPARPQDKIGSVQYQKGAPYNSVAIDPSGIYAGCNAVVQFSLYHTIKPHMGKLYVCLSIMHIMKVYDNTPFTGGGGNVEEAFGNMDLSEMDIPAGATPEMTPPMAAPAAPAKPATASYDPFSVV